MRDRAGGAGVSVPGLWARGCTCRTSRAVWRPARVDQHARAPAVTDGQTERRPWSVVGERLRWLAPGRSGAADRGRTCQAIGRRSADAPGRGPRPAGPSGLSPRARGLWVRPPARWDSSCGSGPRGSTSRAGGKHPPDAGLRGSVSSAVLILQAPGCGTRPAGPVGLSLRALGPLACPSGLSFMARTAVSTSRPRGTQPTGSVPRRSTILPGGTERPSSGRGGRPPVPSAFGLRARCSTSQHGLTEPPRAVLH